METEICVIGGGPAGSTVARRLALLGHDVCLIERAAFPRPHIGESLPPGILPLLDVLGVCERVEQAGFLRPTRAIVRWSDATDHWKLQPGEPGFQVDRGRFDHILLEAAREVGVHVLQPAIASRPVHEGPQNWRITVHREMETLAVHAAFVVDASGRRLVMRRRKQRCSAPTLALYGYWRNAGIKGVETRIEAGKESWYWGAPLPDGTFNATVFLDPARCTASGRAELETFYRSLLAESALLRGCLEGYLCSGICACDATCYAIEQPSGPDWLCAGEAVFSIDPLSSQGVQTAIGSGLQAAIVAHTLLTTPENAAAALEFYQSRQCEIVAQHRSLAARHYAEQQEWNNQAFWKRRAGDSDTQVHPSEAPPSPKYSPRELPALDSRVTLAPDAVLRDTPCVQNNLIVNLRALHHSHLARPVVFLGGVELAPLLDVLSTGDTIGSVIHKWSKQVSLTRAYEIAAWMISYGILVPISDLLRYRQVGER